MGRGFAYLVAVMDYLLCRSAVRLRYEGRYRAGQWHSRAVLSWRLSNTLDVGFCLDAFRDAVEATGRAPAIFNTDQGCQCQSAERIMYCEACPHGRSQFTSRSWRELLEGHGVRPGMDGKGRWVDNVFIERLWRSVKYEEVYLREYGDLHELERALGAWFESYNHWRPHDSLGGARPWEIYRPSGIRKAAA